MAQTIQDKMRDKLFFAAEKGNLEEFKNLLESPEVNKFLDLADNGYQTLKIAASHCNEEFLDYILNRPEVNDEIMTKVISYAFTIGCRNDDVNILHFYFNHEKYGKYLDLTYNFTWCFKKAYENRSDEALKFLIINAELPKNEDVLKFMEEEKDGDKNFVNHLFDTREMMKQLKKDLNINNDKQKINKKI